MAERIQKALARLGLGSRREIESWIAQARVVVDDQPAVLGQQITERSKVLLDGKPVRLSRVFAGSARVILYHKPVGEICSRDDPQGRPSVFDRLPRLRGQRWVSVGRLDINTSGILIFTTDGDLAHRLMHPSSGVEREYRCRVRGVVTKETIDRLLQGIRLDRELCRFESVSGGSGGGANQWFRVVIKEGRYREVRRLWQSVGCTVNRLIRTRYGPFTLDRRHPAGQAVELGADFKAELVRSIDQKRSRGDRKDRQATTPGGKKFPLADAKPQKRRPSNPRPLSRRGSPTRARQSD